MPATVGCARDDNDESRRRRGADLVDNSVNYGVVVSGRCLVWIHLHWDGTGGGGGLFGARGSMKWNVELWIGISSGLLCLSVCCVAAYVRALSRPITCDGAVAETVSEVEVGGGGGGEEVLWVHCQRGCPWELLWSNRMVVGFRLLVDNVARLDAAAAMQ